METRVKERLVGAVILVGLIVVLVPEMLSGPKETETLNREPDQAMRTYTIDLTSPGAQPEEVTPRAHATRQLPPVQPEPAKTAQAAEQPPPKQHPPQAESRTQAQPAPANTPPPATSAPPPKPQPAATGSWAVQVGSFAKSENAKRLSDELRAKGHPTFTVTTGKGAATRYKVRIGPQETRAQADRLVERLKREGKQAAVVSH